MRAKLTSTEVGHSVIVKGGFFEERWYLGVISRKLKQYVEVEYHYGVKKFNFNGWERGKSSYWWITDCTEEDITRLKQRDFERDERGKLRSYLEHYRSYDSVEAMNIEDVQRINQVLYSVQNRISDSDTPLVDAVEEIKERIERNHAKS
jgi:hypothetical protein